MVASGERASSEFVCEGLRRQRKHVEGTLERGVWGAGVVSVRGKDDAEEHA
jgi:hypothetical protein